MSFISIEEILKLRRSSRSEIESRYIVICRLGRGIISFIIRGVQITPKTSTDITRYLYSRKPVRPWFSRNAQATNWIEVTEKQLGVLDNKSERKKRGPVTYSTDRENEVSKVFIILHGD